MEVTSLDQPIHLISQTRKNTFLYEDGGNATDVNPKEKYLLQIMKRSGKGYLCTCVARPSIKRKKGEKTRYTGSANMVSIIT